MCLSVIILTLRFGYVFVVGVELCFVVAEHISYIIIAVEIKEQLGWAI